MLADFTLDQANDLARYFLGKTSRAQLMGPMHLLFTVDQTYQGASWREAFRAAGVYLPLRSQYIVKGTSVMYGATAICTAPSNTLAKRIAAALNNHIPDRRGI